MSADRRGIARKGGGRGDQCVRSRPTAPLPAAPSPRAADPVDEMEDDGTYKYYDSSKDKDSPAFVPVALRDRWRHSQLSRWDVGNPLPQSAPSGTVLQTKDGTPSDFWCAAAAGGAASTR